MSHYGIPVDRQCGSYRPGHEVHWIHAKKASEKDQPLIAVSITSCGYGWVDIQGRRCESPTGMQRAGPRGRRGDVDG